ncbi:hypothetical protein [Pseudomonas kitaguniensis]|uniref:hypothetical protein n=1 Tax=Pseudomonas kitaguniensis TaxID=2607908 RepID=UPI003CFD1226
MSYLFAGKSMEGCLEILANKDWNARDVADYLVCGLPEDLPLDTETWEIFEFYRLDIPEDAMEIIDWGTVETYVKEWLESFFAERAERDAEL